MTDDFKTRFLNVLDYYPNLCPNGCETLVRNYPNWREVIPKTRGFPTHDKQVERIRRLCDYITGFAGDPPRQMGTVAIGSYSLKHMLENLPWTEGDNTYVSNGEAIVAMLLCGFKPKWSNDPTNPNCVFNKLRASRWKPIIKEANRRANPPPQSSPY